MRRITCVSTDIERCQAQIAAIYAQPKSEQCQITLEGFQLQLKKLILEKAKTLPVIDVVLVKNTVTKTPLTTPHTSKQLRKLAQHACNYTIAEATKTRRAC